MFSHEILHLHRIRIGDLLTILDLMFQPYLLAEFLYL